MKRLSLKTRLVLLHTVLMTLIACAVLALLFSLSSHEILTSVQRQLEERVSESFDSVQYVAGHLDFDSDLMELKNGIYLSVYEEDHELVYGKIPYGFPYDLDFSNGEVRTVSGEGSEFYVLDLSFPVEGYHTLMMRGIVSISDAEQNFRYTLRVALLLLPALIVISAVCGYFLSRKALDPVDRITRTVRRIQREHDLSARVRLGEGKDEIYTLAGTFDDLLDAIEVGVKREKQFTSDVSHELRTPVSVILMQCEEALERRDVDEGARAAFEVIRKKAQSISNMISQLLLLSRADQGRAQLHMEELDFSELSQMAVEEFEDIAAEKKIRIHSDIHAGIRMEADQTLMIRLWSNLLRNAVTYGNVSGNIWVCVAQESGYVRLSVRDDGIGISEKDLPHIWERFYQADPSRTDSESSGLGLSLVRWIVEAHGGTISAQSTLGVGTEFICLLPLRSVEDGSASPSA